MVTVLSRNPGEDIVDIFIMMGELLGPIQKIELAPFC